MDEELIELKWVDINENEIQTEDVEQDIQPTEDAVYTTGVEAQEEIEIQIEESVGWSGGSGTGHYSLYGRDDPNQHPITSITGLRTELDDIKALKTVFSNRIGVANYYAWNSGTYDEYGYFVSLVPHTDTIKVCDGTDIFGVTVDNAGFVGNQDAGAPRGGTYGLVATSGIVDVQCESDVAEGDYVISNARGVAAKTDTGCGYKVIAIAEKNGIVYATISLGVQACTTDLIGRQMQIIDRRVGDAEDNIAATMNTANDAYNKSVESGSISKEAVSKALEALAQANGAVDATEQMNQIISSVNNTAVQAKTIAESAALSAESIRKEAYDIANDALSNVNDLIGDLEPITQWEDPESGNTGAEYLTTYISNGLATKIEVQTVETATKENKTAILKNADGMQTLVSSVDKYSVGEHSQSYGLTAEQAANILKPGMIYIPTLQHAEDLFAGGEVEFLRYAYYEWDGEKWIEFMNAVSFAQFVPAGNSFKYWYVESDNAQEGYEAHALYVFDDNVWTKVNMLSGNVNNRITSMIRQDVDEVRAEVVNAYGSVAGFGAKLSDTDAKVNSIALWPTDNGTHNIAVLESKTDDTGSYMVLATVTDVDGNAEITELSGAKIILKDGENGSYIQMDADKINFTADDYRVVANNINLYGNLVAQNLLVKNGDKTLISATTDDSVIIGGFTIGESSIYKNRATFDSGDAGVYIGTDGISTSAANITGNIIAEKGSIGKCTINDDGSIVSANKGFKVDAAGNLNATSGNIGGWVIKSNKLYSIQGTTIYDRDYGSGFCMQMPDLNDEGEGQNNVVLAIGTVNEGDWSSKAQFKVLRDGQVFAKEINADKTIIDNAIINQKLGFGLIEDKDELIFKTTLNTEGITLDTTDKRYYYKNYLNNKALIHEWWHSQSDVGTIPEYTTSKTIFGSHLLYNNQPFFGIRTSLNVENCSFWSISVDDGAENVESQLSIEFSTDKENENSPRTWCGELIGTWKGNVSFASDSDRNLKHDIEVLSDEYETFYDNLRSVRFKYNSGTSNRYHTGFIAQDVEEALSTANLSTNDAALFVRFTKTNPQTGEKDVKYGLRYDEFISLNTWQIQKLKARVTELEAVIKKLQEAQL